ncbi:MAG: hypothetical protein N3D11_11800 [Candidatus Sumerlaeia bacterium]|nr:hypothetical protein [Candidatus Sumerlaeia bacterium]
MFGQTPTHRVSAPVMALTVIALAFGSFAAALDVGGALDRAKRTAQQAKDAAESAARVGAAIAVPPAAATYFRQLDQKLERMDRMMGEDGARYDKDYRMKESESLLKGAKEDLATIESRYGAKMGKDHPEIVARRDRIAAAEKKLETFKGTMSAAIQKEKDAREAKSKEEEAAYAAQKEKQAREAAGREAAALRPQTVPAAAGKILFSKSPIDPAKPANLTTSFKAGDTIYGLILADKTWRELYNAKGKSEVGIMIVMAIGKNETYQYITLKNPKHIDSSQLVLDIAPAPDKMTAYKDPEIVFGEGKGNRKIGPIAFTYELAQLPAGKHTVQFYIRDFGKRHAAGQFDIEGADFKFYADLHEKVKALVDASATMPPVGMVNKALEGEMLELLENAGWPPVLRLVIRDKDWWLNRVAGGDSPVSSRHINAAVAAKGPDGKCYYRIVVFEQPMTLAGWGKLEITQQSDPKPIAEENINK